MLAVAFLSVLINSASADLLTIDSVLTGCLISEDDSGLFRDFSGVLTAAVAIVTATFSLPAVFGIAAGSVFNGSNFTESFCLSVKD